MKIKNVEDIYPLSPMQQGMLFHTLYASESRVYFEQLICILEGNLSTSAFEQAWQQVVERHPVLRTAFIWEDLNEPLQIVRQQVTLSWEQHDWRELSPPEQQEQLEVFLQAERQRGFDLSQAPLMRLALIQVDENTYQFIWCHHHLLLDGWSLPLVFKEVFTFYEALRQGENLYLKRSRPYRDYIAWLQQQDLAKAEAFWRQTLQGLTAPTPLVVGKALGSISNQEQTHAHQQIQLSKTATAALESFARQHQLTVNTLLQGAWALLLSRYSGQEDVVFGTTVSGRPPTLTGVESMVGLFINTLPLRVQVSPQADLLSWLKQLQTQHVEMRSYEYSPLVQVQGWSDVPRRLPLFESIVVFENYPIDASLHKPDGSIQIRHVRGFERTNYALTVAARLGTELSLLLSYDCRRFDAETIGRMLGHLQTLLEGMVTNQGRQLADLPLLTPKERQQLLVEWNHTQIDSPQDVCIHQLFESQAERSPDAVALVFEDKQLTYFELNQHANQVAHYLHSLGVGADAVVGLCLERSLEAIVGILGALKAGGAYLPLDPAYPKDRLTFMLEDAQVSVLLTQQQLVDKLPEHNGRAICLDTDWQVISQHSCENPISRVTPDNLAYVIYTSGSTGRPKGVIVGHSGLCNLAFAQQRLFDVQPASRVLQFASLSFDASVWEIFMALSAGATLVLAKRQDLLPGATLIELLRQQAITIVTLPPSVLAILPPEELTALQTIIVAGEACSPDLVARWSANRRFFNAYGPTEATVCATIAECNQSDRQPPIGRPIANTQVYLLDAQLQPVPVGVPGELYIGGVGLAKGYLNRPDLTAEKFIANPFDNSEFKIPAKAVLRLQNFKFDRLYKTGDLVRYLSDGNIEFLGRIDHQIKIRGFRIDLLEIEVVLSQHPAVREVAIAAREDIPGDKRLVAYVVLDSEQAPTITELRRFLEEKLPNYMLPSAFVLLKALPLTHNGKIDRQALPLPENLRPELLEDYVAPQSEMERIIATVWQEVLQLEKVGVHDNFFDLGAHSLLVIQAYSKLRQLLNQELSVVDIFEHPTISTLANYCSQKQSEQPSFQHNYDRTHNRTSSMKQQKQLRQKHRSTNN
ncbi:amino acid adenylation domain-containing protein [Nostoc sp.]|uniref:amino acid adenylation domain-containing protein n=1 Tax=Nostoc sp. TaxID=1180 RepID=UPI002FF7979C